MMLRILGIAPLLTAAACADEPPEPQPDPQVVERFLEKRDPAKASEIERRVDLEQAAHVASKAPLERSSSVARGLAER